MAYAQTKTPAKIRDTLSAKLTLRKEAEFHKSVSSKSDQVTDSLKNILRSFRDDSNKVNVLNDLSDKLETLGEFDSSLVYGEKAETLAAKINYKKGDETALRNIGVIYYRKRQYKKALEYQYSSLAICQQIGNKKDVASASGDIGLIYLQTGNYVKALENSFKVLAIAQEIGNENYIGISYTNIGLVYYEQGNFSKALEYFHKAIPLNKSQYAISDNLNNVGNIYYSEKNYTQALESYTKSLSIADSIGYKNGMGGNYDNIAGVYDVLGNYHKALEYNLMALKIAKEIGDNRLSADVYSNLGEIYTKLKSYKIARIVLDSCLIISKNEDDKQILKDAYGRLASLDSSMGNLDKSYQDYKFYVIYRDSMVNQESTEKITRIELNNEFQKVVDSIKLAQKKTNSEQTAEISRKRVIAYSLSILLILAGILSFFLIRNQQRKRREDKLSFDKETHVLLSEKDKAMTELANARAMLDEYVRSLMEKNKLLEQTQTDLENIKKLSAKEIEEDRIENLEDLNNTTILTDDDWNQFKKLFEQAYKGFFIRLKEKLPDLTQAEIRYMCLTKLQLDAKQMGRTLGVSYNTIKSLRHRLRKKLGLSEKDSLADIVNSI
jgi:tetratricopeptide (TPR) repeat protein